MVGIVDAVTPGFSPHFADRHADRTLSWNALRFSERIKRYSPFRKKKNFIGLRRLKLLRRGEKCGLGICRGQRGKTFFETIQ